MKRPAAYDIGIDEVGRGSLAGPVYVAAVMIPRGLRLRGRKNLPPLRDSKQLSPRARDRWKRFADGHPSIVWAIGTANHRTVDAINISRAADRAACAALRKLLRGIAWPVCAVAYLDAGLRLHGSPVPAGLEVRTMIKADEKIPAVSLASIVAKVSRDRFMAVMDERYPGYGFVRNAGYGTLEHRQAILRRGPSAIHRRTFLTRLQ